MLTNRDSRTPVMLTATCCIQAQLLHPSPPSSPMLPPHQTPRACRHTPPEQVSQPCADFYCCRAIVADHVPVTARTSQSGHIPWRRRQRFPPLTVYSLHQESLKNTSWYSIVSKVHNTRVFIFTSNTLAFAKRVLAGLPHESALHDYPNCKHCLSSNLSPWLSLFQGWKVVIFTSTLEWTAFYPEQLSRPKMCLAPCLGARTTMMNTVCTLPLRNLSLFS